MSIWQKFVPTLAKISECLFSIWQNFKLFGQSFIIVIGQIIGKM